MATTTTTKNAGAKGTHSKKTVTKKKPKPTPGATSEYAKEIKRLFARLAKAERALEDAKAIVLGKKEDVERARVALRSFIADDTPPLFKGD